MRGRNLKKLLDAINLLATPCGTTITELGSKLEIDKRQAYRVIETLQDDFRFVIDKDKAMVGGEVRYYLEKDQYKRLSDMKVADLNLSLTEIIALYFLKGHAKLYRNTDIEAEIEQAFAKLDVFVPEGLADRLDKVKTLFIPSTKFAKDYSGKEETIETLTDAILQQKTCLVEYHSFYDDKVKVFKIDPLRFFERNGGLYLFVRTTSFGHIRVMAVERIVKLTLTEETFSSPENFDPDALLEEAFDLVYDDPISVKIRFSADQARYIQERRWAKEQKIRKQKDGSIILEMTTSGWWDVKRWVMTFGSEAEVIEPVEMRDDIRADLEAALGLYN
ncbi:helix-turn-helix transcriptional regulator [Geomobilimonas luticola]|uniref:WYL domain-containing protein n=1 Tax=Geomobilimonas luticola TaxID=1114878 RepID=A0ABS5SAE6_9BACT|nr:WYL domain-containing protein [Geomobilimonas luticola]MBT0652348.1 WYL domain-containing protein [Geomobilimonas luticola]